MLLALAWAALQGDFSLQTLLTGQILGYVILVALVRGGVLSASPYVGRVHRVAGLVAYFLWELIKANLRLALDVATPQYHLCGASREHRSVHVADHGGGGSRGRTSGGTKWRADMEGHARRRTARAGHARGLVVTNSDLAPWRRESGESRV
jgi:hypothetical protein